MSVRLSHTAFDPLAELATYQKKFAPGSHGATASFIGTLRDFNNSANVRAMTLEYYLGMTEKQLEAIAEHAKKEWAVLDVLIVHRVGTIEIGEPIVLTAAWAAHREPAFAACRYLIEKLKTDAPFWKKEQLSDNERWV
jgi:molybdopterin synthase catalytic subunit